MLSIGRIIIGTFLIGLLWSAFSINPLITGIIIGALYGLTDMAREHGRIK